MSFLCPQHQALVAQDEQSALSLWHGAILNGESAFNRCCFEQARVFFGTAFEIAKIRLVCRPCERQSLMTPQHLNQASSRLTNTLYLLEDMQSVQQCLLEQHYLLLFLGVDEHQDTRWQKEALTLLDGNQTHLVRLLKRLGQEDRAHALNLITDKVRQREMLH